MKDMDFNLAQAGEKVRHINGHSLHMVYSNDTSAVIYVRLDDNADEIRLDYGSGWHHEPFKRVTFRWDAQAGATNVIVRYAGEAILADAGKYSVTIPNKGQTIIANPSSIDVNVTNTILPVAGTMAQASGSVFDVKQDLWKATDKGIGVSWSLGYGAAQAATTADLVMLDANHVTRGSNLVPSGKVVEICSVLFESHGGAAKGGRLMLKTGSTVNANIYVPHSGTGPSNWDLTEQFKGMILEENQYFAAHLVGTYNMVYVNGFERNA